MRRSPAERRAAGVRDVYRGVPRFVGEWETRRSRPATGNRQAGWRYECGASPDECTPQTRGSTDVVAG
jgi:hypothetical protein